MNPKLLGGYLRLICLFSNVYIDNCKETKNYCNWNAILVLFLSQKNWSMISSAFAVCLLQVTIYGNGVFKNGET